MNPLTHKEIFGNWATLLLPINSDNSIDFVLLQEQISQYIESKVDGIYSNGTAGEFFNQTEAEFDRISCLLAERCNDKDMRFQIGCSHVNPLLSLERVQRAVQLKPGGIQVILPDWIACDLEESTAFLEKIAESAGDIAIVLYSPGHARAALMPEDFYALKKRIPTLAGCKVAWKDVSLIEKITRMVCDFSVFVPGHHLATGITVGARGAYSNVACLNPLAAQRWYQSMLSAMSDALDLEYRIQSFIGMCVEPFIKTQGFSNTAADKFMAAVGGWSPITPRLRWPYKSIPESEIRGARDIGRKILPEFF